MEIGAARERSSRHRNGDRSGFGALCVFGYGMLCETAQTPHRGWSDLVLCRCNMLEIKTLKIVSLGAGLARDLMMVIC